MTTIGLNTFVVILIFGSLVLLSFLTIANPLQVNRKANYWFGIFLFLWSMFWLDEIAQYTGWYEALQKFALVIHLIQFLTPIVFYFSILFFTNPNFRFRLVDMRFMLLPVLYFVLLLLKPTVGKENQTVFQLTILGLILSQVFLYVVLSFLLIRRHQKKILTFASNTVEIDLSWLEYIISAIVLLSIVITSYNILFNALPLNVFLNCFLLFMVYVIAYFSLKQKEIFPLDQEFRTEMSLLVEEEPSGDSKRKLFPESDLAVFKTKLSEVMKLQKPYLDSELNLLKLAELVKMTPHQLSYIINTGFDENFFQFVNTYRVEKAKEMLVNDRLNKLSILGIAFDSGFNSKTAFNTTFKKITGQTPSEFKRRSSGL